MAVGQTGPSGEPAVLLVAVEPKTAVVLAPIPLRQRMERNVLGTLWKQKTAIQTIVHVSILFSRVLDIVGLSIFANP